MLEPRRLFTEARPPARPLSVAFVSTCSPRQCGIATFTGDLANAVKAADPSVRISRAAIDETSSIHPYGPEVRWRIRQGRPESYREAAEWINASTIDVVSVQHEFGLYGTWGETFEDHLAPFMEALRKPLVTTLHTVLPDPSPSVREAVRRIGRRSRAVVAMAELARRMLVDTYGLAPDTVRVIHHGVPAVEPRGRTRMKERLGLSGRTIISTFGLVDPRKGLEYMIEAMARIAERHPDALYLVVGRTHPELVRKAGETYRNSLYDLVRARGLDRHVAFVDEYLTQRQIVEYLLASDAYVTPYLDPNQITSGTLAYAMGAGKAIVSTRYLHATEALADGRGILVDFRSADQLADAVLAILGDPVHKRELEWHAYAYGREMAWPRVGERMLALFRSVADVRQPVVAAVPAPLPAASAPASAASPSLEAAGFPAPAASDPLVAAVTVGTVAREAPPASRRGAVPLRDLVGPGGSADEGGSDDGEASSPRRNLAGAR